MAACSEDIMDSINENPNNPKKVASKFILTDIMTSTAFSITSADYAFYSSVYMELNVGIFGQMYNAETRVSEPISSTTYNNVWVNQYANLYELKTVREKCSTGGDEAGNFYNLAIAQVLTAYNLAMLTDVMGDVPYTEALQPGVIYQPKIDKQEALYTEVFKMLDDAIANFAKTTTFPSIGTQDLIFAGDKAKWTKAAQGLKARYLMRLSLKTPQYQKVIDAATASFASAAEEFKYVYTGSNSVNPFSRFLQDRNYFGTSKSLNDKLVARNDPRKAKFFKPGGTLTVINIAPNGTPDPKQNFYGVSAYSSTTAPTYLMSFHELQFLKAEAYARITPVQTANAEAALKLAIQAAFVKVGLTAADATTYYTTSVKALFDANPLKEIMMQKYLAAYEDEGIEAYNDYRRTVAMGGALVDLANTLQFPQRFTYGSSDVTTNLNVKSAYGDGSYVYTDKVWWAGGTR
jgi:hypothetical protein